MTQEELINVFKYIVKKCDMLINNGDYKADDYTQDTVEDIAELCNHILDGIETKEVDLEKELQVLWSLNQKSADSLFIPMNYNGLRGIAKNFFELGMRVNNKARKGE